MTRALALLLVVGLASPALADDAPRAVGLAHAYAVTDDGRAMELDGGVWLRDDVAEQRAKRLVDLAAENDALKTAPPPTSVGLVLTGVAGVIVGAVVGVLVALKAKPAGG